MDSLDSDAISGSNIVLPSLQERCVQYWPGEPLHSETYGGNTVEMAVERNSGPYTYRELHVTNNEVCINSEGLKRSGYL